MIEYPTTASAAGRPPAETQYQPQPRRQGEYIDVSGVLLASVVALAYEWGETIRNNEQEG